MKILLDPELAVMDMSWKTDMPRPVIGGNFYMGNQRDKLNNLISGDRKLVIHGCDISGNRHCGDLRDALACAYIDHHEVTITPDMIWFGLMCEASKIIKANVEYHRHLFSRSAEKIEICVGDFDPRSVIAALRPLVPEDVDKFLPKFTTSDEMSTAAICAAFADMVRPYYGISMYTCGIRAIEILGTREDWKKVLDNWVAITRGFLQHIDRRPGAYTGAHESSSG